MNKTITINLNGIVYHIAEDAYANLQDYLTSIKNYFAGDEDKDEIIADIESRLGELFSEKLGTSRQVVMIQDVDEAIKTMGTTADFESESESENDFGENAKAHSKKLFRDTQRKILGGVLSGISAYFGIKDPLWLRLGASVSILAAIFGYWGFPVWLIIVYALLWLIVPKTKSNIDQIRMQGKPVNLSKIKESFNEQSPLKNESIFHKTFSFAGELLSVGFSLLVKAIEILFKSWLWLMVIVLPLILLAVIIAIASSLPALNKFLIGSTANSSLVAICAVLLFAIPIFFVIYAIARTMFKTKIGSTMTLGLLSGLWILSILGLGVSTGLIFSNFAVKQNIVQKLEPLTAIGDTIYIKASNDLLHNHKSSFSFNMGKLKMSTSQVKLNNNEMLLKDVKLNFVESADSSISMSSKLTAKGKTKNLALKNVENLSHGYSLSNDTLYIDNFITQNEATSFREQQVTAFIAIPTNTVFVLDKSISRYVTKMANKKYYNAGQLNDSHWAWQSDGLNCVLNCNNKQNNNVNDGDWASYDLSVFSEIEAEGNINITITQSDSQFVMVNGEEGFEEYLEIEVSDNVLEIDQEVGFSKDIEIQIGVKDLLVAEFAGAGDVLIEDMSLTELNLELAGAISADVNIDCDELEVEMAGATKLVLNGVGYEFNADVIGASKLYAKNYECKKVELTLAGACKAEVFAENELEATALGSSRIIYYGNPKEVSKTNAGASSIKKSSKEKAQKEETTSTFKAPKKVVSTAFKLPKVINQTGLRLPWF